MKYAIAFVCLAAASPAFADETDSFKYLSDSFVFAKAGRRTSADASPATTRPRPTEAGDQIVAPPNTLSRAQVIAEREEAARQGLLRYGEAGDKVPAVTPNSQAQARVRISEGALGLRRADEAAPGTAATQGPSTN